MLLENVILTGLMINLICLVLMWPRQHLLASKLFIGVLLSQWVWEWGYFFEVRAHSIDAAIFWDDLQFIPYFLIAPFWLYLSRALAEKPLFTGSGHPLITLSIPLISIAALVMENQWGLFRVANSLDFTNRRLSYDFGPLFYVTLLWTYGLIFSSISILLSVQRHLKRRYRQQILAVLVGILLPLVTSIPIMLGYSIFGLNDISPFTFALGNLAIVYGLFRLHAFEFQVVTQLPVLAQLPIGILILDHRQRVIEWNELPLQILKLPAMQPGFNLTDLPIAALVNLDKDSLWEHERHYYEIQFRKLTTPTSLDSYVITLKDQTAQMLQKLSLEISNQTLANLIDELRETQEQILATEKHNSVVALIQSLAHEFNTPLGNLVTLMGAMDTGETLDEYTTLLKNNVQRLVRLIERIKEISSVKIDENSVTFSLRESINDVANLHKLRNKNPNLTITVNVKHDLQVTLPRMALEGSLIHLMSNALQHAFPDDPVDAKIDLCAELIDDHLRIVFKDNGVGIPKNVEASIFLPFTNNATTMSISTGIGLFSVHQWVTQTLKGRIRLINPEQQGTHFEIQCPLAQT